jgi:hypothetical protein
VRSGGSRNGADAAPGPLPGRVLLRAERAGAGDGRVYALSVTATDGQGGACTGKVGVGVPLNPTAAAVDSAPPAHDTFGT